MIIIKLGKNLLHDCFAEHHGLCLDIEAAAIFRYCRHLAVIKVDNLTMPPQKGGFLLFQVFRIHIDVFSFFGQSLLFLLCNYNCPSLSLSMA